MNKNIKINQLENLVKALPIAFHNKNSIGDLKISNAQPGKSNHLFLENFDGQCNNSLPEFSQASIGYKLESFITEFLVPIPNHIKIDVDGNEDKVIDGLGKFINDNNLKSIMVEINLNQDNEFLDEILSCGFKKIENKEFENQDYIKNGIQNIFFIR